MPYAAWGFCPTLPEINADRQIDATGSLQPVPLPIRLPAFAGQRVIDRSLSLISFMQRGRCCASGAFWGRKYMGLIILVVTLAGLVWGTLFILRGSLIGGCLAFLLSACCFSHTYLQFDLGPL